MRLIDADQLDQYAYFTEQPTYDAPYSGDYVVKMEDIENIPTINPEDLRPKGKWEPIYEKVWNVEFEVVVGYKCSVCGREEPYEEPFCHCGAKMEE